MHVYIIIYLLKISFPISWETAKHSRPSSQYLEYGGDLVMEKNWLLIEMADAYWALTLCLLLVLGYCFMCINPFTVQNNLWHKCCYSHWWRDSEQIGSWLKATQRPPVSEWWLNPGPSHLANNKSYILVMFRGLLPVHFLRSWASWLWRNISSVTNGPV